MVTLTLTHINKKERTARITNQQDYIKKHAHPKLYISAESYNVLDDLLTGRQRPYSLFKKQLLNDVLKKAGLDPTQVKASWSQTAGCGCGCSPAFILKPVNGISKLGTFDIFATFKAA
jgi:hypothetical protein